MASAFFRGCVKLSRPSSLRQAAVTPTLRRHFAAVAGSDAVGGLGRSGAARSRTVVLVCDMQEAFAGRFVNSEQVTRTVEYVLEGCEALGVPVVVSEHQPEKLGETVASVATKLDNMIASGLADKFHKTRFSMRGAGVSTCAP